MTAKICDAVFDATAFVHVPLMNAYMNAKHNAFFNSRNASRPTDQKVGERVARAFEAAGDTCLTPLRYLCNGKTVRELQAHCCGGDQPHTQITPAFAYDKDSKAMELMKTVLAIVALPLATIIGSALKGIAFCSGAVRESHRQIEQALRCRCVVTDDQQHLDLKDTLAQLGIDELVTDEVAAPTTDDPLPPLTDKQKGIMTAVHDISAKLSEADIPHFLSCGSLIGSYRYGSMIPWDRDGDMGILRMDHQNVMRALRGLDPDKYEVQDWSCSRRPDAFIRVYMKEWRCYIDLDEYTLDSDPESGEAAVRFYFSWKDSPWQPDYAKARETVVEVYAVPLRDIFPLKQGLFGKEADFGEDRFVPVPANWEDFLKRMYHGYLPHWSEADLSPCKVWNPATSQYDKVAGHPYWNQSDE